MQYLILHGSFGNSQGNWFPWLKTQLESENHLVIVPDFPIDNWEELEERGVEANTNQTLTNWLNHFQKAVHPLLSPTKPNSIAAHSLGPLFTLHTLTTFDIKVDTAVFVAPFLNRLPTDVTPIDIVNSSFYLDLNNIKLDFNKIKQKIKTSYVLYSDNDPYVPTQQSLDFAQAINAKPIQIKSGGHLNATAGYTKFPQVYKLLSRSNQ